MRKLLAALGCVFAVIFSVFLVELLNNNQCPEDLGELLRYSLYDGFNSDYLVTSTSEFSPFFNILVDRHCSYELEITGSEKKTFITDIEASGTWKQQPACSSVTRKRCGDSLERIVVIDGMGLVCVSRANRNTARIYLSCKDIY